MIPAEAVEAAAKMLDPQTMGSGGALAEKFKEQTRAEARRILEAAAPYMLAVAWEEGKDAVWTFMSNQDPMRERPANPYMRDTDASPRPKPSGN